MWTSDATSGACVSVLKNLPDSIKVDLKLAKKSFRDPHLRRFAGLSPIKSKDTMDTIVDIPVKRTPVKDYPKGTQAIFIPLSSIPGDYLSQKPLPAKTRKLYPTLSPSPATLTTSLTKAGNFQSSILDKDLVMAISTCRAPSYCFLIPKVLRLGMFAGITKIILEEEEILAGKLDSIMGSRSLLPSLAPKDPVYLYPKVMSEISKVRGYCMLGRVYPATFEGTSDSGALRLSMMVDKEEVSFTAARNSFCCSVAPSTWIDAQELIQDMESTLMGKLQDYLDAYPVDEPDMVEVTNLVEVLTVTLDELEVEGDVPLEEPVPIEEPMEVQVGDAPVDVPLEEPVEEEAPVEDEPDAPVDSLHHLVSAVFNTMESAPEIIPALPLEEVLRLHAELEASHKRELAWMQEKMDLLLKLKDLETKCTLQENALYLSHKFAEFIRDTSGALKA